MKKKMLCHVLKLRGNAIGTCKGTIPYSKKRAYKALYNVNQIKIKDKQGRDAALRGEIVEFQDKLLSAHFPAVSGTSQRKRPRHQESDTDGPFPLILLPLFGLLVSSHVLSLLPPSLPAPAGAAVGCQRHCHFCCSCKPLPPVHSAATAASVSTPVLLGDVQDITMTK